MKAGDVTGWLGQPRPEAGVPGKILGLARIRSHGVPVKWPVAEPGQQGSFPSFIRWSRNLTSRAALPWPPLESWTHGLHSRGREKRSLPSQQEETRGKKRSIHVVNGTLFLPITVERKGTFPSGSGERKGPLWGEKPARVVRKETPARACGTYSNRPSPSALCLEGVGRRHLKSGFLQRLIFLFYFSPNAGRMAPYTTGGELNKRHVS